MATNPKPNSRPSPVADEISTQVPDPNLLNGGHDTVGGHDIAIDALPQPPVSEELLKQNLAASQTITAETNSQTLLSTSSPASPTAIVLVAIAILLVGLLLNSTWIGFAGALVAFIVAVRILWQPLRPILIELVSDREKSVLIAALGGSIAAVYLLQFVGVKRLLWFWYSQLNWEAVGALGEVFGALGQIMIAVLAVYIAWRQYVIEKVLTIQQNLITQQQTIDSFFQGISDLVLDEEGQLEDWPQERAIAKGRTASILSSVDSGGKAKIIRFLSSVRLLSPLRRDQRLGRAILDGAGGYEEDRMNGVRVIDLGAMLAKADLSNTDLRWTDLSSANLSQADLSGCDLVKANLSRTILFNASLIEADLQGARLFYGNAETASPRSRTEPPDYETGEHTGAVIENADFTDVKQLSPAQRYYCCAWGGTKTRNTIPDGCEGIPNKLKR